MVRAPFNIRRLIPWLGLAVLVLGGLCVWRIVDDQTRTIREPSHRMAERQIREQRGTNWEVLYIEAGTGPVLCGYAAPRSRRGVGYRPVAFISRIGRVQFADDPLPTEFRDIQQTYCPGFAQAPRPSQ